MAPRPNSQSEPSSRRAISKSSKTTAGSDLAASLGSFNPRRSRQAKHSPFPPRCSPQTEQTAGDTDKFAIALASESPVGGNVTLLQSGESTFDLVNFHWQRLPLVLYQNA